MEKIRYYPKSYVMSENLKIFFQAITNDVNLQQQLYETQKIMDVVLIASQRGFSIDPVEVLQAQAGRVLAIVEENPEDTERLITGLKPFTGAQSGRGGGGFLDRAGYWLLELPELNSFSEEAQRINESIQQIKRASLMRGQLLDAKTFDEAARVFNSFGFAFNTTTLLSYQAEKILALSSDQLKNLVSQ